MERKKEEPRMNVVARPQSPAQSLKESLKEMKLIREGKKQGKSWRTLYNELKNEKP